MRRRTDGRNSEQATIEPVSSERRPRISAREYFLQLVRNPVSISNLIVALAAGNVLQYDKIPPELLPAVVLLATVGLRRYQQQIVDDYVALLRRAQSLLEQTNIACQLPSGERMQQMHMSYVYDIFREGPQGEYTLGELPETRYLETLYGELVAVDTTDLYKAMEK